MLLLAVGVGSWVFLGVDGRLVFLVLVLWVVLGRLLVPSIIHEHIGFSNRWIWHDYRKANQRYRQAVQSGKATPQAYCALASLSFAEGDYIGAASLLEEASGILKSDPALHLMLLKCLMRTGQMDRAVAEATKVGELFKGTYVPFLVMGDVLKEKRDTLAAATAYQKACGLKPSVIDCRLGLAEAYYDMGQIDASLEEIEMALRIDSTNSDALYWAGKVAAKKGNAREASSQLQRSLMLRSPKDKSHRVSYQNILSLLAEVRRFMAPLEKAPEAQT